MEIATWTRRVLGTGLVLLGAAAPALAREHGPKPGEEPRQVTVTVKSVDPEHHKVTFEAHVKPEAGGVARLDSLKVGEQVRATFDPATGEIITIEALAPPPATGKTPAD
jgi:hypothetical protein